MNGLHLRQCRVVALVLLQALPLGPLIMPSAAQDGAGQGANQPAFVFRNTGDESGLLPLVQGIHGHGAGWGDVDGDGWLDLYVGTFHSEGPANLLLLNRRGHFVLDDQASVRISTRATGVVFADLDNDGDLDLYVASMPGPPGSRLAERTGRALAGCSLFRNDGGGKLTNVSEGNGGCPLEFGGRSVAVFDYDGDGLLDFLVGEDPNPGYNGSPTKSSRLFHNRGELQFADVTQEAGIPEGIPGLGVAAADVNNDGRPDFFLASSGGGNRLFLNNRDTTFREAPGSRETFEWPTSGGDNMVCGVAFGDVNEDGLLDVVIGQHYDHPWSEPVANRLYLNRGINDGVPRFEDVTEQAGLVPLPMKAPHVEIQDFDNDGRPDIATSIVKFADGRPHPVIFRQVTQGIPGGVPKFHAAALQVNEFPAPDDKAVQRSGPLFDKILRDRTIIYSAPGPSADYDFDGRLDLFLPSWWTEAPSLLLHNETPGGHWLDVLVEGTGRVNRQGIGSRIRIYPARRSGEYALPIGEREVGVGFGYASGQAAITHFGLGDMERVDIEVVPPHGQAKVTRYDVGVDQRVRVVTGE